MKIETIAVKNKKGEQAICIPKYMEINNDKVYLKKIGNALYVIPFHSPWQNMIESIDSFTSDFMDVREQREIQHREAFD
jgi:antitoxin VapB